MKFHKSLLLLAAALSINFSASNAQNKMAMNADNIDMEMKGWPEASKMAAHEMIGKYGKPNAASDDVMIWLNAGPWKKIIIDKKETKHSFPIEHTDMLMQTISYKVSSEMFDELAKFDGSVIVDRTQGLMSARCDKEANNFLALNLANDILTNKKTVESARKAYGDIVKEKMNGGNPEYMQKLTFTGGNDNNDPDINTTGLTKEDVMKGGKK